MKKIICLVLILLLCGCTDSGKAHNTETNGTKICGVWISCYELNPILARGNFKEEIREAAIRLSQIHTTDAFVHVRAFGDSLFDSKYYPQNENTKQYDFDVLEYIISVMHQNNIRFHAWINPFRRADGTFSDPADKTARANILNGIREIINGYDIDGIHFDDYFYSSQSEDEYSQNFKSYEDASQNPLTVEEYRISAVNSLIFDVRSAIKFSKNAITFSISPSADIEKNRTSAFADVRCWCQKGTIDLIIPQLYFGFEYPDEKFRFENLLNEWKTVTRAEGVKLAIGLPAYKLGTNSAPDSAEWLTGEDILSRQTTLCLNDNEVSGICFFSYTGIFADDDLHRVSLDKLKKVLDKSF